MENKTYTISEEFLKESIKQVSRSTVGRVLKRIDLFHNREVLKISVKELIYENFRTLEEWIESFSCGVKFISPPKDFKKEV